MTIKVNGTEIKLDGGVTVKELLVIQKVEMPDYVTVQINDEFISTADYENVTVKDGDIIEFLYYMGGGR